MLKELLLVFLIITAISAQSWAEDVSVQVKPFGDTYLLVMISGTNADALVSNISEDGKTAKVSGLNVTFNSSLEKEHYPKLLASIAFSKSGPFSEMVVNLSESCVLSATTSTNKLTLMFKVDPNRQLSITPLPSSVPTLATSAGPINSGELRIVMPQDFVAKSGLAADLERAAYLVDVIWNSILGVPARQDSGKSKAELEKLVQDLTEEVVRLRDENAACVAKTESIPVDQIDAKNSNN